MIVKEFDYIKGSTATKPLRRSTEADRKKYEELKRSKKNRERRQKEEEKKKIYDVYKIVFLICLFGIVTVLRDGQVMNLQREVTKLNSEIKLLTDENEGIRVELLKVASLDNIKTNAESKLSMTMPTKDQITKIDLSQNYFAELEAELTEENNNEKKGLFSKLMGALD